MGRRFVYTYAPPVTVPTIDGKYWYITNTSGNTWKSEDYGVSFTKLTTLTWTGTSKVGINSTGQYILSINNYSNSVYKLSSDYGASWVSKGASGQNGFTAALSSTGQYMLVSRSSTWDYSSDYGANFSSKGTYQPYGLAVSDTGQYMLASGAGAQLTISSNYGVNFALTGTSVIYRECCMSGTGQYMAAASKGAGGTTGQIYISSNYGQTWTATGATKGWYSIDMSKDGKYILAGEEGPYLALSSNYGQSWSQITNSGSPTAYYGVSVSYDGKYMTALGISGGFSMRSENYGATWSKNIGGNTWFTGKMNKSAT